MSRLIKFFRVKHRGEVSPLSRPVMLSMWTTQPISAPLQSDIRFFSDLLPASPSIGLAASLPLSRPDTVLPSSPDMPHYITPPPFRLPTPIPMTPPPTPPPP